MISDDDLRNYNREEMMGLINRFQNEKLNMLHDHSSKMKEVNRRLQTHLLEIRGLKDVNRKLQDDNQELRDLCCFLDDDRQKCRKLSKEWQRFGKYTSGVIKTEVATSQKSVQELSEKQQALLKDNEDLKELVIYLDEQRGTTVRDQGDGSSSGTSDDQLQSNSREPPPVPSGLTTETVSYITHLEERIDLLEQQLRHRENNTGLSDSAVSQAMKVLEVHKRTEKLSISSGGNTIPANETLLLRELCNVAWRNIDDREPDVPIRCMPQNSRV